jgi:transcriptional regulator
MKKDKSELLQGTVDMLILRLLQSGPLNGWDIMQRIELVSSEVVIVLPGSLYPALHRLERRKMIASEWGESVNNRRAKFYKLTAAGRKQLYVERESWARFSSAIDTILRKA